MNDKVLDILRKLEQTLEQRRGADAQSSYVASLYAQGNDKILKKLGEEAAETIIAVKNADRRAIVHETADLWFHTMVMLVHNNIAVADIAAELERRFGLSGLEEKAGRNKD